MFLNIAIFFYKEKPKPSLIEEINLIQIPVIYFTIISIILISIIIYLLLENKQLTKKIQDAELEINNRRRITYKVIPILNKTENSRFFWNYIEVNIGYKIQYFMDDIPFVETSPKIIFKCKDSEVNSERIKNFSIKAVELGNRAITASQGNPLALVEPREVVRHLLPSAG